MENTTENLSKLLQFWKDYYFTIIACGVILVVAVYFICLWFKYRKAAHLLDSISREDDPYTSSLETTLEPIAKKYKASLNLDVEELAKSNTPSDFYYNEDSICRYLKLNKRFILMAPNTFVGLGLLGTFLGLAIGVGEIEITKGANVLLDSIASVLHGMSAAFYTSIFGMILSLGYQLITKNSIKTMHNALVRACEKIDRIYYVDDIKLSEIRSMLQQKSLFDLEKEFFYDVLTTTVDHNQKSIASITSALLEENKKQTVCLQSLTAELSESIQTRFEDSLSKLVDTSIIPQIQAIHACNEKTQKNVEKLNSDIIELSSFVDEDGDDVRIANAIRDILDENRQQTKSMKSFSTDLAYAIQERFQETLSKELLEKVIPMMTSIDATTNKVVQHIDAMSDSIKAPAAEMVENVVGQLKESMNETMHEIKENISANASRQLEQITDTLSKTTDTMTDLPVSIEAMSQVLQNSMTEVQSSMDTMREANMTSSKEIMNSIGLQFDSMVESMGKSISQMTENINSQHVDLIAIQENTTKSQRELVEEMNKSVQKVKDASVESSKEIMENVALSIDDIISSMHTSINTITEDLSKNHKKVIEDQEVSFAEHKKMLSEVNKTVTTIKDMQDSLNNTLSQFKESHGQQLKYASHMQSLTDDLRRAQLSMATMQSDISKRIEELTSASKENSESIAQLISESMENCNDFTAKCETIREGMGAIFAQLQRGLTDYTKQVQHSTQSFLTQYATSLTETTSQLNNTIQYQSDVVEEMKELLKDKNS